VRTDLTGSGVICLCFSTDRAHHHGAPALSRDRREGERGNRSLRPGYVVVNATADVAVAAQPAAGGARRRQARRAARPRRDRRVAQLIAQIEYPGASDHRWTSTRSPSGDWLRHRPAWVRSGGALLRAHGWALATRRDHPRPGSRRQHRDAGFHAARLGTSERRRAARDGVRARRMARAAMTRRR
jgi:hypothetical protein